MGILNITPDSFSDGGQFFTVASAVKQAIKMEQDGADIIDVGGESTRPSAIPVTTREELCRVVPVINALLQKVTIPLSIDTTKAEVAQKAIELGVSIVNDISGLTRDPEMISVVSKSKAGLIIMHSRGTPQTMQKNPRYKNIIKEVYRFLEQQMQQAIDGGISKNRIAVDPGIGFGKTVHHNVTLINRLADFLPLGVPILIGPSRKSFIRVLLNATDLPNAIHDGTAVSVSLAIANGARIVRVHDVESMKRVSQMADAILRGKGG